MIDEFVTTDFLKQFNYPNPHQVSGKTVTVRMWVMLTQIMPAIHEGVESEGDRVMALYRAHKLDINLLSVALERGTPLNTVLVYVEKFNIACWDIIQKDIGTWGEDMEEEDCN